MSDKDPPPPYTAEDATKFSQAPQPTAPPDFKPQTLPSAPTEYAAVAYYPPAASTSGNASVLLQPQQQQQHQIVVVQTPQVVVVPQVQQSFTAHICLSCLSCLCCFSVLCCIVAFVLAGRCPVNYGQIQWVEVNFG